MSLPCNLEVNPITHFGVIALFFLFSFFFYQIFKILILFVLYFKNYKRQMLSLNCKHVQYVKIYLPCNFEVNLITHLGVIALFSSPGQRPCELLPSLGDRRPSYSVNFHILIFSSETTRPIATKLWWNVLWMDPFQNCVL